MAEAFLNQSSCFQRLLPLPASYPQEEVLLDFQASQLLETPHSQRSAKRSKESKILAQRILEKSINFLVTLDIQFPAQTTICEWGSECHIGTNLPSGTAEFYFDGIGSHIDSQFSTHNSSISEISDDLAISHCLQFLQQPHLGRGREIWI